MILVAVAIELEGIITRYSKIPSVWNSVLNYNSINNTTQQVSDGWKDLFNPDFGSRLHDRVFDPVNISALVKIDIRDAIRKYEPRVKLLDVNANLVDSHLGVVKINIGFTIKGRSEVIKFNYYLKR